MSFLLPAGGATVEAGELPFPTVSGIVMHFRSDNGITSSGGLITQWDDMVGSRNLTASGAARPTLVAAELNGKPILDFDGSSDFLAEAGGNIVDPAYYIVYRGQTTAGGSPIIYGSTGPSVGPTQGSAGAGDVAHNGAGTGASITATNGTWFIVSGFIDGANSECYLNDGATVGAGSTADRNFVGGIEIGSGAGGTEGFTEMECAEIIIHAGEVTGSDHTDYIAYLNSVYKIF